MSPGPCCGAMGWSPGACWSARPTGCRRGASCCASTIAWKRGEIRGGRFIAGLAGEQFALAEAVGLLREVRKRPPDGAMLVVSAVDPLNLVGGLLPGEQVPAVTGNRLLYRDGAPLAALVAGKVRMLAEVDGETAQQIRALLIRRH